MADWEDEYVAQRQADADSMRDYAMERDAERYRWLITNDNIRRVLNSLPADQQLGQALEMAIDAAMRADQSPDTPEMQERKTFWYAFLGCLQSSNGAA